MSKVEDVQKGFAVKREQLRKAEEAAVKRAVAEEEKVGGIGGRTSDSVTITVHEDRNPYKGKTRSYKRKIDEIQEHE